MKKTVCLILVAVTLCINSYAVDVSAHSALLYDSYTDSALFEKNADERLMIASTTKIMTALLAAELYDFNADITVLSQWCGIEGSSMYLTAGEKIKIGDLVYGTLLMSGNDAATALASLLTGKVEDFVALMNEKALELGLHNTHFTNPSGLDHAENYSSAADLAKLAKYALSNPLFARVCSTKQINAADRFMTNHNKLLFSVPGAIGVKTGYTDEAGRCLVSAVCRDKRLMIAVTLSAPDDWADHERMYENAFLGVRPRVVVSKGLVGYATVAGRGIARLHTEKDVVLNISEEEVRRLEVSLKGSRIVYGGHSIGEKYGIMTVRLDGNIIHTEPVFFSENVDAETPKQTVWDKIKSFFTKG